MPTEERGRWVTINGAAVFIPNGEGGSRSGVGRLQKAAESGDRRQLNFLRSLLAEGGHTKRDIKAVERQMERVSKRILDKS